MSEFTNLVYVPYWMLILLLFLASGAVQYAVVGGVRYVQQRARDREQRAATVAKPELHVVHLEPARISDEDLRERTEGLR